MASWEVLTFDLTTARAREPVDLTRYRWARVDYLDGDATMHSSLSGADDQGHVLEQREVMREENCDVEGLGVLYLTNDAQAGLTLRLLVSPSFRVGF